MVISKPYLEKFEATFSNPSLNYLSLTSKYADLTLKKFGETYKLMLMKIKYSTAVVNNLIHQQLLPSRA